MKSKVLLPLIISLLAVSGCTGVKEANKEQPTSEDSSSIVESSSSEEIKDYEEKNVEAELTPFMSGAKSSYKIPVTYKRSSFFKQSTEMDKDLAVLSFGLAATSGVREHSNSFYQALDFDNIYFNDDYYNEATKDTVAYGVAHRKIEGVDLVAVSLRSNDYGAEWANNFLLGEEGNHNGFDEASLKVFTGVSQYLTTNNYNLEETKLWITGYSRGGALANLLAVRVMESESLKIHAENLFTYTFEAPRAFSLENVKEYPNIHNFFNSADLVASFAPAEYGLYRVGQDYDIYDENAGALLAEFDAGLVLPALTTDGMEYSNDIEHLTYIMQGLLKDDDFTDSDGFQPYAPTRKDFAEKYQPAIMELMRVIFSMSGQTRSEMIAALSGMQLWDYLSLLQTDGLYNFLKPYVDKDNIEYEEETLKGACNRMLKFATNPGAVILADFMGSSDNLKRMIYFHTFEVNYVLLKNYLNK